MVKKIKLLTLAVALLVTANYGYGQALNTMLAGTGAAATPYQIKSARDLDTLSYFVRLSTSNSCLSVYFQVMNDIDMSVTTGTDSRGYAFDRTGRNTNFIPIGGRDASLNTIDALAGSFRGNFNGGNFTIKNLKITGNISFTGLFGCAGTGAVLSNIRFDSCQVSGNGKVGTLYGRNRDSAITISNCHVSNSTVTTTGAYTGIFAGEDMKGTATNCSVTSSSIVNTGVDGNGVYCAAFCGDLEGSGTVSLCFVRDCSVTGSGNYLGGFAGDLDGINVYNCYVTNTTVNSTSATANYSGGFFGGFFRTATIKNCYSTAVVTRVSGATSTVGGFNGGGAVAGTATNCYYINQWNNEGLASAGTGTAMTAQAMLATSFVTTLNTDNPVSETTWASDDGVALWQNSNFGYPIFTVSVGTAVLRDPYIIGNGETVVIPSGYVGTMPNTVIVQNGGSLVNELVPVPGFSLLIEDGGSFYNKTDQNKAGRLQRDLFIQRWNLISSPLGDDNLMFLSRDTAAIGLANINSKHSLIAAYSYDYSNNAWLSVPHYKTDPLGVCTNMFAYPLDGGTAGLPTTAYFDGTFFNTGATHDIPSVLLTAPLYNSGRWLALGNPYPGRLYANRFIAGNSGKIQGNAIYHYNEATAGYDVYTTTKQTIKPAEGFMMAISASPSAVTFAKNMMDSLGAKASVDEVSMNIIVTTNNNSNYTKSAYLKMKETADNGFDINDAYVLKGQNNLIVEPYFLVDDNGQNQQVIINVFNQLPYTTPMNLFSMQDNDVAIRMTDIPQDLMVTLVDLQTGIAQRLDQEPVYETWVNEGENEGRFVLMMAQNTNGLAPVTGEQANVNIWAYNNRLTIEGVALETLKVYNAAGLEVFADVLSGNSYTALVNQPAGTYIAKVTSKSGNKAIKFVITK
ncbi:MAG: T9SS type A sorting domain-containing protein [Bacteroidales bacterium]|jgi:hypothetical protein|nr:T9SS type A sorting domain-containing protein [Bacteroidales bacterium]